MKVELHIADALYDQLIAHLLPARNGLEEAAFLFAHFDLSHNSLILKVISLYFASHSDFIHQGEQYLHLSDQARVALIKEAHNMGACLIETHSHPGPWAARFSAYDNEGLREIVPHMKWRLPNRPYAAIVVAPSGFDALVWLNNSESPTALARIVTPTRILKPTNLSVRDWI